jgi:cytochrome c oxidase subunit 2
MDGSELAGNYRFGLPIAASTYAGGVDAALNVLHVGMALIFVLWSAFFIYCLVRFRAGRQAKAEYAGWKSHATSFLPDFLVLSFEIWLIFFFGLPIWSQIKEKFPAEEASHRVDLSAEQFSWGFQYPGPDGKFGSRAAKLINTANPLGIDTADEAGTDDIVVYNELHVPLGKPTLIYMTSKDVIHSFFVPEFRVKQDIVPGMRTPLWFEPTKAGRYEIGCAQLCGTGHYVMRGEVVVHPTQEDFDAWMTQQINHR